MAEVIELPKAPKTYRVDVTHYPDNLTFTVEGVKPDRHSLRKIADELEKIVQIIRSDVVTGLV